MNYGDLRSLPWRHGRGDVQAAIMNAAPAGGLYDGGNGRGDLQAVIMNASPVGGLYDGGDGRGDDQTAFVTGADIYYSRGNSERRRYVRSNWRTSAPGPAIGAP
ncbi:MAG: hypothetical protein IPG92_12540 [Flavobacteriales bacterium]|nr:hypothetical protein [Flavobacteriales bacterium]